MPKSKTYTVELHTKDPDAWQNLIAHFDMPRELYEKYLDHCEYATVQLDIDKDFRVAAARVVS